jgi:WD40 repeat protein
MVKLWDVSSQRVLQVNPSDPATDSNRKMAKTGVHQPLNLLSLICVSYLRLFICLSQDFPDHEASVTKVLFGPDGTSIASCSEDRTIKIWDARSYQLLQHYPAHDAKVTSISMHPSGLYMLSSSEDCTV